MNSLSDILKKKNENLLNDLNNQNHQTETSNEPALDADEKSDSQTQLDIKQLETMVYKMKDQLDAMLRLLRGKNINWQQETNPEGEVLETGERVIEGVFNGEKMIGPDGKEYMVPPNYASKSKLVEGDMMKLTITNKGAFIFKQIGPVERKRIVGELVSDPSTEQWSVLADGRIYKILTASVTFYKGHAGDEVVLLVPQDGQSEWGAVENIINK